MRKTPQFLGLDDTFSFSCHPGIECFTQCCQDVNILLTPYDIARMKNRLGMTSTDFLERHTKTLIAPATLLPAIQLKMEEDNRRRCSFVTGKGCGVYEDRPWSCRMYPLDHGAEVEGFMPIVDSSHCLGLNGDHLWQVRDWFADQGLEPYENWHQRFAELTEDSKLTVWRKEYPGALEIFHLACYDLDRFRDVVFKEKLFEMVDFGPEQLKTDDFALLEFAFTWLKAVADRKL